MDIQLIDRCKKGDRKAMEFVFHQLKGKVRGWCYKFSRTDFDIEEILQESFIKIFSHIQTFSNNGPFEAWARTIVVNTAINYYRRNQKYAHAPEWFEEAEERISENAEVLQKLSLDELHGCIRQLPEGYRMVFVLFAIEGYSHKEIADMLQIKENTSSSQYAKAKKFLIRLINKMQMIPYGK